MQFTHSCKCTHINLQPKATAGPLPDVGAAEVALEARLVCICKHIQCAALENSVISINNWRGEELLVAY